MPSYESSMENLEKARVRWRQPRPWRSKDEGQMIRRLVFWWSTCRDRRKPSGRDWARQLGISHTWLQKLVREFTADPSEMWRLRATRGDPQFAELSRAQECTREMKERGELRPSRRAKCLKPSRSRESFERLPSRRSRFRGRIRGSSRESPATEDAETNKAATEKQQGPRLGGFGRRRIARWVARNIYDCAEGVANRVVCVVDEVVEGPT
jgi:hypothetical protein